MLKIGITAKITKDGDLVSYVLIFEKPLNQGYIYQINTTMVTYHYTTMSIGIRLQPIDVMRCLCVLRMILILRYITRTIEFSRCVVHFSR